MHPYETLRNLQPSNLSAGTSKSYLEGAFLGPLGFRVRVQGLGFRGLGFRGLGSGFGVKRGVWGHK